MSFTQVQLFLLLLIWNVDASIIAQTWALEKDKDHIQVFTRKVEGFELKEYKAVVTLKTTIAALNSLMKNHDNLKNWFVRCPESKLLKKISEEEYYLYFLNDAPWPVSDRDNITKMTFELLDNGTQLVHLKGIPDFLPKKEGIVRLPRMQATWTFEPQANGMVKVTQQVLADLGGKVPAWLVNMAIVDAPYETLCNLRKEINK